MKFFDTHCHLNVQPLSDQLTEIITDISNKQCYVNIVGVDLATSLLGVKQAHQSDHLYATIGIHPSEATTKLDYDQIKTTFDHLLKAKKANKIIGIGETGLDFYRTKSEEYQLVYDQQIRLLKLHYEWAVKFNLPLILHVRNAHEEMISFLKKHNHFGIIHCFTECWAIAQEYLALGQNWYLSIPGIVTFNKTEQLQLAVKNIPLERLVIETDAPWLAPVPYRGKTNYPYYSWEIILKIAELKQLPVEVVSKQIWNNTIKLFNLKV